VKYGKFSRFFAGEHSHCFDSPANFDDKKPPPAFLISAVKYFFSGKFLVFLGVTESSQGDFYSSVFFHGMRLKNREVFVENRA